MSPDNHHRSPFVLRLQAATSALVGGFPHLALYLVDRPADCRGLTMFLGDTAEWVVGLRIFSDDGSPEVLWSSGDDPLIALINLDKAVGRGNFKVDKRAVTKTE